MALPLAADIQANGWTQGDIWKYLSNVQDIVNELQADHATYKTAVDDLKSMVNLLRYQRLYRVVGTPAAVFAIDTNFDVKNTEVITYLHNGVFQTLADNTNCDTGTAKTIAASQWAAMVITGNGSAALAGTWTATAASEAAAIILAKATALAETTNTVLGVVTVNAHASGFTAGTDALTTGAGGNVATATNYYNDFKVMQDVISSAAPASLTASATLTLLKG